MYDSGSRKRFYHPPPPSTLLYIPCLPTPCYASSVPHTPSILPHPTPLPLLLPALYYSLLPSSSLGSLYVKLGDLLPLVPAVFLACLAPHLFQARG